MIFWLLPLFFALLAWDGISTTGKKEAQLQDNALRQRAIETIDIMNHIVEWRNNHRDASGQPADAKGFPEKLIYRNITGAKVNWASRGNQTFVWQQNEPGLMSALIEQSRFYGVAGKVEGGKLKDSAGKLIAVNFTFPADSLVFLH